MTTYTNIFGGSAVFPSQVSYNAITLTGDVTLSWPLEGQPAETFVASTIDVTSSVASYTLTLPDATGGGNGFAVLVNSLQASTFGAGIKDASGNLLCTVAPGEQWMLYLASNATEAGVWRTFRFGASTASVNPTTISGYGIINTSGTLSQAHAVTSVASSPRTVAAADRAGTLVWTGSGSATFNLTAAATLGNNFFILLRNAGGGDITVDPNASETIDGASTLALQPGESAILVTDGTTWYSVGLGRQAVFAFDFTSISLASAPATYTLSGAELNRVAYKFTGLLTNNVQVIVPATIQQYWVDNRTTGAYSVTVKTASGSGIVVNQSTRGIYYCDGTDVVTADTAATSLPINPPDGGTGITSYTTGDLLYASSSTTMGKLADVATGNALISGGVGVPPSWGKIGLTTHVSGSLPVANGGTGVSSFSANYVLKGNGAGTAVATSVIYDDGTNIGIGTATPGQKLDVSGASSPYIRISTTSGTNKRAGLIFDSSGTGQYELAVDLSANNTRNFYIYDQTATATRLFIDSSGNVGFGTNSPGQKLDVAGSTAAYNFYSPLTAGTFGTTTSSLAVYGSTGSAGLTNTLTFTTNSTERMRIDNTGNVGIGTTSANARLSLGALVSNKVFALYDDGTNQYGMGIGGSQLKLYGATGASVTFGTYARGTDTFTETVRIDSSGNLGVGTSSPAAKLDVVAGADQRLFVTERGTGGLVLDAVNATNSGYKLLVLNGSVVTTQIGGVERMRVDASGNVVIGASTPYSRFTVVPAASPTTVAGADQITVGEATANSAYRLQLGYFVSGSWKGSIQAYENSAASTLIINGDGGAVGIGTTTPGARLDVTTASGNNIVVSRSSASGYAAFQRLAPSGQQCYDFYTINGTEAGRVTVDGSNYMAFSTGSSGTERVRIDSAGNVGIGTSSPGARLHVDGGVLGGTSGNTVETAYATVATGANACYIMQRAIRTATGTDWTTTAMRLQARTDSTDQAYIDFNPVSGQYGLAFGTGSSPAERMRIDSSGNVGIGTSSPTSKLQVYGGASATDTRVTIGNAAENLQVGIDSSNNGVVAVTGAHSLALYTNSTLRLSFDSAGTAQFTGELRAAANISTGYGVSTADVALELGGMRSGSGNCYIDMHSTSGTDYEARIIRASGTNGGFTITNGGTGTMTLQQGGVADILFQTNSTDRTFIKGDGTLYQVGRLGLGTSTPTYKLDVVSDDTAAGYTARLRAPSSGSSQTVLQFTDNGATAEWGHIRAGSGGIAIANPTTFSVEVGGASKLSFDSNGDITTPNRAAAVGYRGAPSSTTTTTAAVGDLGKVIKLSAGITIPASVFAEGAMLSLYNNTSGSLTITQGSGLTMYLQGTATTGNRTIPQRGFATIWFVSATECVIGGVT